MKNKKLIAKLIMEVLKYLTMFFVIAILTSLFLPCAILYGMLLGIMFWLTNCHNLACGMSGVEALKQTYNDVNEYLKEHDNGDCVI